MPVATFKITGIVGIVHTLKKQTKDEKGLTHIKQIHKHRIKVLLGIL